MQNLFKQIFCCEKLLYVLEAAGMSLYHYVVTIIYFYMYMCASVCLYREIVQSKAAVKGLTAGN